MREEAAVMQLDFRDHCASAESENSKAAENPLLSSDNAVMPPPNLTSNISLINGQKPVTFKASKKRLRRRKKKNSSESSNSNKPNLTKAKRQPSSPINAEDTKKVRVACEIEPAKKGCHILVEETDSQDEEDWDDGTDEEHQDSSLTNGNSQNQEEIEHVASYVPLPPVRWSVFPNTPPCLNFCLQHQKVEELPWVVRRHLKWKMSPITPIVIRKCVHSSGFRLIKNPAVWLGTWGKHMKSFQFATITPCQKINHFPGTFQIGRKDRLWRNVQKMAAQFPEEFNFLPQTFILPSDVKALKKTWEKNSTKTPWIVKPPASARGTGIQVIHKWSQLPKQRPLVVQSYVERPLLLQSTKFDIRLYVLATSVDPLRIHLFHDGLVRFASLPYSSSMASLSESFRHLTNYSINRHSEDYVANDDADACSGHKWTLQSLWAILADKGVNVPALQAKLKDLALKTLLSASNALISLSQANVASPYSCYELFGLDVLLDEEMKPWLLEVNISPSLHSSSALDMAVKGPLARDVLNMARFHLPDKVGPLAQKALSKFLYLNQEASGPFVLDHRLYTRALLETEREKQEYFVHRWQRQQKRTDPSGWQVQEMGKENLGEVEEILVPEEQLLDSILDELTPSDVRMLIQSEDELTQRGGFERIFPTRETGRYLRFLDTTSYRFLISQAWENKYAANRGPGIERLRESCAKKLHLLVPDGWEPPVVSVITGIIGESSSKVSNSNGRLKMPTWRIGGRQWSAFRRRDPVRGFRRNDRP